MSAWSGQFNSGYGQEMATPAGGNPPQPTVLPTPPPAPAPTAPQLSATPERQALTQGGAK